MIVMSIRAAQACLVSLERKYNASVNSIAISFVALVAVMISGPTSLFGNTLKIKNVDGSALAFYLNPDGSYTERAGSVSVFGSWYETKVSLCFAQQQPTKRPVACGPMIRKKVGDVWMSRRPDGLYSILYIIPGRPK